MPKRIIWRRRTSCPKCGSLDIKREEGIRLEYCGKCGNQWVVPRNKKLKNSMRDYQ
jgi:ribosomal protein L37AE/L43A